MKSNISLSTELRQTQTMAPALVHSLKLLEKPMLELSAIVKEEIASNPILEQDETSPISIDDAREQYEDPELFDKKIEQENELPDTLYSYDSDDDYSSSPELENDSEYDEENDIWVGRTDGQAPDDIDGVTFVVNVPEKKKAGDFVNAVVIDSKAHDLIAEYTK